jgi:hypothetical protein
MCTNLDSSLPSEADIQCRLATLTVAFRGLQPSYSCKGYILGGRVGAWLYLFRRLGYLYRHSACCGHLSPVL